MLESSSGETNFNFATCDMSDTTAIASASYDNNEPEISLRSNNVYNRTPWWYLLLKRKLKLRSQTPLQPDGTPEGKDAEEPSRGYWSSEAEFILSLLGLAVGLGNVWRFPWMCWKNGGGVFLIPYTVMLIFCGLPLFLMELTLGQYSGSGPGNVFQVAPLFKGLGWCVLTNTVFNSAYYITVITWSFYYMFSSFQSPLPWLGCKQDWNSKSCYSQNEMEHCKLATNGSHIYYHHQCLLNSTELWYKHENLTNDQKVTSTDEYFNRKMYNLYYTDSDIRRPMADTGPPKWDLLLTLLLAWIVTYLCVVKGIKSSGKVVYFTATFPYIVLLALTVVSARLDGADKGISFYLQPTSNTWRKLAEPTIWADAASQIFYSLGISGGGVMTYASYNKYNNNILRDCLLVGITNSLTSLFAGFPIFCVLGYMSERLHKPVDEVVQSGSALAFIAYPEVVAQIPGAPFWSAIFFFMLVTLGLDSQFGSVETLMTFIIDKKPNLVKKKWVVAGGLSAFLFVLGISTVTMAGAYWQELLNYYAGWGAVFVAFFNVIVYSWVYGAGRIIDHLQHMINVKFPRPLVWTLLILWKIIAPFIIIIIMISSCIKVKKIDYHGYELPDWAQLFGWLIATAPLMLIPVGAVYTFYNDVKVNRYTAEWWHQRLLRLTKPTALWIPSYLKHTSSVAAVTECQLTSNVPNEYGTSSEIATPFPHTELPSQQSLKL